MSAPGDDESESGSGDEGGEGGSSDGEGEEEVEEEEVVRPGSELEKRRMEQAAGDHPLQNTFRWAPAETCAEFSLRVRRWPPNSRQYKYSQCPS